MSKAIFFSFPCFGHINPALGLMKELVQRGENITTISSDEFRNKILDIGADYESYGPQMSALQKKMEGRSGQITYLCYYYLLYSKEVIPEYLKRFEKEKPDYIIFDSMCVWGRIIAEYLQIPSVCSTSMFAYFRGFGDRLTDWLSEIFYEKYVEQDYPEKKEYQSKFKELSEEIKETYSIKKLKTVDTMSNVGDMTIVYTSKLFQPLSSLFNKSYYFVGTSLPERSDKNDIVIEPGKWEKVIYISLGTIVANEFFYRLCLKALANSEYFIILKVNQDFVIKENEIPENFIIRRYVAQLEILKQSDLIICHGGMNSVSEALYFGVPSIVIPDNSDQPFVAKQIQKMKCGTALKKDDLSAEKLLHTIECIFNNDIYKENSRITGEKLKKLGGYQTAADMVFQFKSSKTFCKKKGSSQ